MKKYLSCIAIVSGVACLSIPSLAFAQANMGEILENTANTGESGFGLIDVGIYIVGVITFIGGLMGLRSARNQQNAGGAKMAFIAIAIGAVILGWKGYLDAFYSAQGVDTSGSSYTRPTM